MGKGRLEAFTDGVIAILIPVRPSHDTVVHRQHRLSCRGRREENRLV